MNRTEIADLLTARLASEAGALAQEFAIPGRIRSCHVENLLPDHIPHAVHDAFPAPDAMMFKKSMKERKHVAAQMDRFDPLLEEVVYAFQDKRVVEQVAAITSLDALEPDSNLYAGGISAMTRGGYLRPHLDNSHDKARDRYRVLNLLYYVTPDWREDYGGCLQLWDDGPTGNPRTVPSTFNSLAIMVTDRTSWHSVNAVRHAGRRCCVSNYYFSRTPPGSDAYFHATSFRGEYGRGVADLAMRTDNAVRTAILKKGGGKVWTNPHVYRRTGDGT